MEQSGMWVFGYGSLIWQPEFRFDARHIARLDGFARSFCMRSIHHRGTAAAPGLVLALDPKPGSACDGLAFHVAAEDCAQTLDDLRARELVSAAYLEQIHRVRLEDGRQVQAVCYVMDPDHIQYCGALTLEEQAQVIARATGGRGANRDYLYNTAAHLRSLGIEDCDLSWLETRVRDLAGIGVEAGRTHEDAL